MNSVYKEATVRLVFDRYKTASKTKKGTVQMEITFMRKRKWISTGVRLYKNQWDDRKHIINSVNMIEWNDFLNKAVTDMETWIRSNTPFSWEKLEAYLKAPKSSDNFRDYVLDAINGRNDIRDSTKKTHRKLVSMLAEYGKMVSFDDVTPVNILDFDNWLHGRKIRKLDKGGNEMFVPMRQQSIFDFHKLMKTYIHIAIRRGVMDKDPYMGLRFKRGESEPDRYLTEDELKRLMEADMRSGSVARSRDMFVFQCYTGLAYADLKQFDFSKVRNVEDGVMLYKGQRKKTGETFCFILLDKAKEILEKYDYKLPVISQEGYNANLKKAATDADIDKPISSHWGRRTAAVMFANHHVPYEIVAKILGHSDVKTTAEFYARILDSSVIEAMKKAGL